MQSKVSLMAGAVALCGAFLAAGLALAETATGKLAWAAYVNPRFGYTVYYPADLFKPGPEIEDGSGRIFVSEDGKAQIKVSGRLDEARRGAEFYSSNLKENGETGQVTGLEVDAFWYTFTADRGETQHFERVVFTCREQIVNRLELTYPTAEREAYEAIIPKLVQRFQGGLGYDTPDNCV